MSWIACFARALVFCHAPEPRPVHRGAGPFARGVARHQRELMHRHEQAVALGVGDLDAIGLLPVQGQALHAAIDADAVILVHHVVADLQGRQLGEREPAGALEAAPAAAIAREDLVVGEHREAGRLERESLRDEPDAERGAGVSSISASRSRWPGLSHRITAWMSFAPSSARCALSRSIDRCTGSAGAHSMNRDRA